MSSDGTLYRFRLPYWQCWWQTGFSVPSDRAGRHIWIIFHGINSNANIRTSGKLIADTSVVESACRFIDLKITKAVWPGVKNCIAIEIFPPKGMDLTITRVDRNLTPPDREMGIWYDVKGYPT